MGAGDNEEGGHRFEAEGVGDSDECVIERRRVVGRRLRHRSSEEVEGVEEEGELDRRVLDGAGRLLLPTKHEGKRAFVADEPLHRRRLAILLRGPSSGASAHGRGFRVKGRRSRIGSCWLGVGIEGREGRNLERVLVPDSGSTLLEGGVQREEAQAGAPTASSDGEQQPQHLGGIAEQAPLLARRDQSAARMLAACQRTATMHACATRTWRTTRSFVKP